MITSTSPSSPASATAPRPPGPERADRVRLVDEHPDVVAVRELDDLRQRGDVAVEPEQALGGDQRAAAVGLAQPPREVLGVAVVVGERVRARELAAVHDRGMAELVVEHDLAAARERRDHAEVGQRAGAEQQPGARAAERRQALLEPPVQRHRARRDARRAGADAPAHRRVGRGLADPRVVGQAERVAGAEQQHRPAVEHDARTLGTADHPQAAVGAQLPQLVETLVEIQHRLSSRTPCARTVRGTLAQRYGRPRTATGSARARVARRARRQPPGQRGEPVAAAGRPVSRSRPAC